LKEIYSLIGYGYLKGDGNLTLVGEKREIILERCLINKVRYYKN
jgi:hypothetical protein